MNKRVLIVIAGLSVLILVVAFGLRQFAANVVESESFLSGVNESLEGAVKTVLPHAMTEIKGLRLTGLATLEVRGLSMRSDKQLDVHLDVPKIRITPALLSLFGSAPVRFTATGELGATGKFSVAGSVPKFLILDPESRGGAASELKIDGTFSRLNAVLVSALVFAEVSNPSIHLTRGMLTGDFSFKKPLGGGRSAGGKKSGELKGALDEQEWGLSVGPVKAIKPPSMPLLLRLKDYTVELLTPVVMTDKIGRATISGALRLSERADRTPAWDLDVNTEGVLVQGSMAKLFKCKQAPTAAHFTVVGPIAATTCMAAK